MLGRESCGPYFFCAASSFLYTGFRIVRPVKSWKQDPAGQCWLMSMTGPDKLGWSGLVWSGPGPFFIKDRMTVGMAPGPPLAKNRSVARV